MKRSIFLLFAIVSVAGMIAISGCKKKETYTVTFNPNGGTGTMQPQTFTEGEAQALTRNAFTYDGYTFTGWNTVQGGSGISYPDGQTITATNDMTLYAQWTSNGTSPTPGPTPTPTPDPTPASGFDSDGATFATFAVSETQTVRFSRGNLQYQASSNTWRFAENQYDIIGSDNSNITSTYAGWIDLFGWGTGSNPTNSSIDYSNYSDFTDWGNNAISNGGNQAGLWRTLTKDEWNYLLYTRPNASSLVGQATVNGVTGLVFLPDNWTLPAGSTFVSGTGNSIDTNTYTLAQWASMELNGAVFLPAAGVRRGSDVGNVGSIGFYWSSSANGSYYVWNLYFNGGDVDVNYYNRDDGFSVRLVRVVQN